MPVNLDALFIFIQFGKDDEPSLATEVVRYKGEPILAIVATSERAAREALAMVRVSYDPLPAVFDVEEDAEAGSGLGQCRLSEKHLRILREVRSSEATLW